MKQFLLITLTILVASSPVAAQILKGKITNQSGEPVQYSTVYIQELKQGTTSTIKGDYELNLPPGQYTVTYQSLGFQPLSLKIDLSGDVVRNVVLQMQYYQIPEVRINASGEDPAYMIMRKAIGLAPYYLNNVSYYKAEVYLKGNLVINKIPRILKKSLKIESDASRTLKAGDSFLMESVNEIEFTAPEQYFQKMISYNSTFPEEGNEISPMSFIQASFYQPVLADVAISPLAPNAFSHYNYKYLGASQMGDFTVNKVQVIPKRKSQQLFEGTLYIIEDLWCLQSVDLTNENLVGKIKIQQMFIPVQDGIWMPVSHEFEVNIGIMGFKADAGYGSSIRYTEVRPNLSLQKPSSLITDFSKPVPVTIDTTVSKKKAQINKILEKDELTNRDMAKLSRLMKKESEGSLNDSSRNSLEIRENTKQVVEKDAGKKDSTYWAKIRPIPLSDIEIKSLRISDSIKSVKSYREQKDDTVPANTKEEKNKFTRTLRDIAFGHTWSDTTGNRFSYNGLIDLSNLSFNSVDGFVYGLDFALTKAWKTGNTLSIFPDIRWAFSREKLIWGVYSDYSFNKIKNRRVFLRMGIKSTDIGTGGGINPFLNSLSSLLQKENYLKLYESKHLTFGYSTELTNGLNLELSGTWEDRRTLENTTNFSILKSDDTYSPNVPVNRYLTPGSNWVNQLRDQRHFDFVTRLTYVPFQKYRMIKGAKIPAGSDWPVFDLTWEHGINEFSEIESGLRRYDLIKFEVSKKSDIGAFREFSWRLRTAGFLDNRSLSFYDFNHFNSQEIPLLINNYEDAFMIPAYYSLSTPEFYVEAHVKYTTPYLLLKLLPVLSNTLMRENLSLNFLTSRNYTSYTEIGYSISEIFFVGEFGVYVGFDDLTYRSTGLKLVLRFN